MPKQRLKHERAPKFFSHVLQALKELQDRNGSSFDKIVGRVQDYFLPAQVRTLLKNLNLQIRRTLEYGLYRGMLRCRNGRYQMSRSMEAPLKVGRAATVKKGRKEEKRELNGDGRIVRDVDNVGPGSKNRYLKKERPKAPPNLLSSSEEREIELKNKDGSLSDSDVNRNGKEEKQAINKSRNFNTKTKRKKM